LSAGSDPTNGSAECCATTIERRRRRSFLFSDTTGPGAIALTRIRCGASSSAHERVNDSTAALVAAYVCHERSGWTPTPRSGLARHARRSILLSMRNPSALQTASKVENVGEAMVRYGLAGVVATIGAFKFTEYEANNIKPLLENSPPFSWLCRRIGLRRTAALVGVSELVIAGLLTLPPRRSRLSALGSVLAMGMFTTTLSFLFSTPQARTRTRRGVPILSDVGQFLSKDAVLLGASVLTLGESLHKHALG
jgi:uncharacterized membrane protein YkgB